MKIKLSIDLFRSKKSNKYLLPLWCIDCLTYISVTSEWFLKWDSGDGLHSVQIPPHSANDHNQELVELIKIITAKCYNIQFENKKSGFFIINIENHATKKKHSHWNCGNVMLVLMYEKKQEQKKKPQLKGMQKKEWFLPNAQHAWRH